MEIRIFKHIFITPFIRLNIYNSGVSISFGHSRIGRIGWTTLGRRGVRETLDTPISGVYLCDGQRWDQILKVLRLRK
jgi:hypothetical protein